jgi:hypothetical protein
MKIRTLAVAAVAASLAASLAGCSAEFSPVNISDICFPPEPTASGCVFSATCDTKLISTPKLDPITAVDDFRLPLQINNALTDNSSAANNRINTNNATVTWFEMTYTGAALQPYTSYLTIGVPSTGSTVALVSLIPVADFPALLPAGAATTTVLVNVRAHGILGSQDTFASAWFQVPVEVCGNACLAPAAVCTPPAVMVMCPGPGQTASSACVTF